MSKSILVSVNSVSKIYHMGEVSVRALDKASIDILGGEILVVHGPSGSGKSTLLNMIGGMDRPTSGTVTFKNEVISSLSDSELNEYRRRNIGFVFQLFNLVPTLTALENVEVVTEIADHPMDAETALRLTGLDQFRDYFPAQLSGGQQQRVAIARALAGNPTMLLCDEPTGALDSETSRQVLAELIKLSRDYEKTIVIITHNHSISRISDRIAHICDGKITSIAENDQFIAVDEMNW